MFVYFGKDIITRQNCTRVKAVGQNTQRRKDRAKVLTRKNPLRHSEQASRHQSLQQKTPFLVTLTTLGPRANL